MGQSETTQHQWIGKSHEIGRLRAGGSASSSFCLQIYRRMLDYVALCLRLSMPTPRRPKKQLKKRSPRKSAAGKSAGGLTPRQREILK